MERSRYSVAGDAVQTVLLVYNSVAFLSWSVVGHILIRAVYDQEIFHHDNALWDELRLSLFIAQTLGVVEIATSLLRWIHSHPATVAIQIFSRLYIIFFIWRLIPISRHPKVLFVTVAAWTVTELIRYSFYSAQIIFKNHPLALLKWLRYSVFIPAYPLGILGEMICVWSSLDEVRHTPSLRAYPKAMPNVLNFQLDLFPIYSVILCCYIPGGLFLYTHMLKRRSKVLHSSDNNGARAEETLKTE